MSHVWPVGREALGSGVYFIFMTINIVCIPVSLTAEAKMEMAANSGRSCTFTTPKRKVSRWKTWTRCSASRLWGNTLRVTAMVRFLISGKGLI
jgi:hypothetical protein